MMRLNTSWKNLINGDSFPVLVGNFKTLKKYSPEKSLSSFGSKHRSILERFESLLSQGKEMTVNHLQFFPPLLFENHTSDPDQAYQEIAQADLQRKIYTLGPEDQRNLENLNKERLREGKPPVDFQGTTHEIEQIMNDSSLSDKEKKDQIDAVRKRLGLNKKDMKRLFTKRLARIYKQAAVQIRNRLNLLNQAAQEAENKYGKNSPQAQAARERLASGQQTLELMLQDFQHKSGLYNSMYPSFWNKLGGFFKKIGKGFFTFGKVFSRFMNFVSPLLRFIPGLGQMISFGWETLKGLVSTLRGNWKGFLGGLFRFTRSIPGIGPLFDKAGEYLRHLISPLRPKSFS